MKMKRPKAFAYVGTAIERWEDAADIRAVAAARRDKRPPVAWTEVKKRLGLG